MKNNPSMRVKYGYKATESEVKQWLTHLCEAGEVRLSIAVRPCCVMPRRSGSTLIRSQIRGCT